MIIGEAQLLNKAIAPPAVGIILIKIVRYIFVNVAYKKSDRTGNYPCLQP
ncbi:hypothetical protein [Nostoc sp. C117]